MPPKLYMMLPSPPVRTVLMTIDSIGIDVEKINIDLPSQENKTPEFTALNPLQTVPLLDDDGYILSDSHAISAYLVEKYAKEDSLYPKDIKKRGKVNEKLHFDNGILFQRLGLCLKPIFCEDAKSISQYAIERAHEAYGFLEIFLRHTQWIAGDQLTIADFSNYTTISALDIAVPVSEKNYPKLIDWMKRVQNLPCATYANEGLDILKEGVKLKLSS
ncbi:glutathione S-transferase epsilon [Rhyzopertha dominica]|nr:glutathione S-transferase epsilon [Rhyzopertha dominica]